MELPEKLELYGHVFVLSSEEGLNDEPHWWIVKYHCGVTVNEKHICAGIPEVHDDKDWYNLVSISLTNSKEEAEQDMYERLKGAKLI